MKLRMFKFVDSGDPRDEPEGKAKRRAEAGLEEVSRREQDDGSVMIEYRDIHHDEAWREHWEALANTTRRRLEYCDTAQSDRRECWERYRRQHGRPRDDEVLVGQLRQRAHIALRYAEQAVATAQAGCSSERLMQAICLAMAEADTAGRLSRELEVWTLHRQVTEDLGKLYNFRGYALNVDKREQGFLDALQRRDEASLAELRGAISARTGEPCSDRNVEVVASLLRPKLVAIGLELPRRSKGRYRILT
ncbi:MAG: hypothetical protein AAF078_10420 [Planctomycetota bacterium]